MKTKRAKKSKTTPAKELSPGAATAPATATPKYGSSFDDEPIITEGPRGERIVMPPPGQLLHEAEEEPNYRALEEYTGVISTLRDKGFSYRDIAAWLAERGVDADHNAVYRVYTNSLSDTDAQMEAEREKQEAEKEAYRNAR